MSGGPGSGIQVSDDVVKTFDTMKKDKAYRCIILKISDEVPKQEVVVEKVIEKQVGDDEKQFKEIVEQLQTNEPRFLLFDMKAPPAKEGAMESDKITFISWIPDDAPIKKRMTYSSTKGSVGERLKLGGKMLHASERGDLSYADFREQMKAL